MLLDSYLVVITMSGRSGNYQLRMRSRYVFQSAVPVPVSIALDVLVCGYVVSSQTNNLLDMTWNYGFNKLIITLRLKFK